VADSERVAVRPRAGNPAGAESAAGAGDILDDDRLAERRFHPLGEIARNHVA
jgi:hypothetical protein